MKREGRKEQNVERIRRVEEYMQNGMTPPDACEKVGINLGYFYQLRKRYREAGNQIAPAREIVTVSSNGHAQELKQLRIENQRLRMIVADQCLDIQTLKEYTGRA